MKNTSTKKKAVEVQKRRGEVVSFPVPSSCVRFTVANETLEPYAAKGALLYTTKNFNESDITSKTICVIRINSRDVFCIGYVERKKHTAMLIPVNDFYASESIANDDFDIVAVVYGVDNTPKDS